MITTNIEICVASQIAPPIVQVVQGDSGRSLSCVLADYAIPSGAVATYYVQKPSGHAVYNAATIDGNTVTVDLTAQALAEAGECPLQVRLALSGEYLTSFDVILAVQPFRGIAAAESTTEMNIFDEAVAHAREQLETVIDPTLSIPDMAADAAAVGAALENIEAYATDDGEGNITITIGG